MKQYLIIFLYLFAVKATSGQDWPATNSQWSYCVDGFGGPFGSNTYIYTRDTLINDTTYAMVRPDMTFSGFSYTDQDALENNKVTFLRQSNDTIFRRVDNTEYLFFINGLNVGDTFTTYRSNSYYTNLYWCIPDLELEVVEVTTVMIAGEEFRRVSMQDGIFYELFDLGPYDPVIYHYIEGIGLENNFPYFHPYTSPSPEEECGVLLDGHDGETLFAYQDDNQVLELSDCVPSGISNHALVNLSISPNPATRVLRISSNDKILKSGMIFNTIGQKVHAFSSSNSEAQVEISNLNPGLYLIIVELANGQMAGSKFVKAK